MKEFEIHEGVLKKYCGENEIVEIPDGVLHIGRNAFTDTNVREVVVPEGVISIDPCVFVSASELRKVVLPQQQKCVRLIDGDFLADLLVKYRVGLQVVETLYLYRLDSDYYGSL